MPTHKAQANWTGNLLQGQGTMESESGAINNPYSASSRFEKGEGTNPEEMIGAAHAGCYSMALANLLTKSGNEPKRVDTRAAVDLEKEGDSYRISKITLSTDAEVPGMSTEDFNKFANEARESCVVSKALTGVEIALETNLKS